MQNATYTVTQFNNCTLLFVLVQMQACATAAQMLRYGDELLDELNGCFEDDMALCGLQVNADGDVAYTREMSYEAAQDVTARKYANVLHEMFDSDGADASYEDLQAYCMLAIVQRNMFIASAQ